MCLPQPAPRRSPLATLPGRHEPQTRPLRSPHRLRQRPILVRFPVDLPPIPWQEHRTVPVMTPRLSPPFSRSRKGVFSTTSPARPPPMTARHLRVTETRTNQDTRDYSGRRARGNRDETFRTQTPLDPPRRWPPSRPTAAGAKEALTPARATQSLQTLRGHCEQAWGHRTHPCHAVRRSLRVTPGGFPDRRYEGHAGSPGHTGSVPVCSGCPGTSWQSGMWLAACWSR